MSFFDGTNGIPARGNSTRFKPGNYPAIEIVKVAVKDGHNGLRFIVEGIDKATGQTGSWTCQLDGKWGELGKAEAKAFAAAALGMSLEQCETHDMEAELERAIGPDQPFAGRIVATEAFEHTTKSGFNMTKHVWRVAEGVTPAPAKTEAKTSAPAAPPPPPPKTLGFDVPAAAPPAPKGLPAGYFHFPANDPRHGVKAYNAEGETIEI